MMFSPIGIMKYSAAIAGIRAGLGGLISGEQWRSLLAASNMEAVVSVLGQTAYRDAVEGQPGSIEKLERRLREVTAQRFRLPMPFLRGRALELYDWMWRSFEINNLIMVLRGIHHNVSPSHIRSDLVELGSASEMDWQNLTDSRAVSQLVDRLKKTPTGRFYAGALANASNQYERRNEVFVLEVALYLAYFRKLRGFLNSMWGSDRIEAERYAGTLIDSQNLLRAYRYRIYFRFGVETILAYSLPQGKRVGTEILKRAASGESLEEVVKSAWNDELPDLERIANRPQRESLVELEMIFRRYLYHFALRIYHGYPMHLGVVFAWMVLLETERDDLITILEGVDNGWPAERIRSMLIASPGPS